MAATPKGKKEPRHKAFRGESRTPSPGSEWIVEAAIECGISESSGFGMAPVSWSEIDAWVSVSGCDDLWLPFALRKFSEAYIHELRAAEDPARQPPDTGDEFEQDRRRIVKDQLRAFIKARS